jgi:hypothetical protein
MCEDVAGQYVPYELIDSTRTGRNSGYTSATTIHPVAMSLPSVLAWVLYLIHWSYPPWYNKFICACRFWSLLFMQDFSVESKSFGISSLSTLWEDLEARYKSNNEVNMTPRCPRTKPKKMENSEDLVRKLPNLAGQGASSNHNRNWRQWPTCNWGKTLEDSGSNTRQGRPRAEPKWVQASRSNPLRGPVGLPFDLAAI